MKKDQSLLFMKCLGVLPASSQNRGGWVVSHCPLALWNHQHGESAPEVFGIKLGPGDSFTNCFACNWHGTQADLIIEMKRLNKNSPQGEYKFREALTMVLHAEDSMELEGLDTPDIEEVLFGGAGKGNHVFPEWWASTFLPWQDVKFAREYLAGRGISPQVADCLDIRVDTKEKRVCFPVRDFGNQLRGLHGRLVNNSDETQTNPRYRMYKQGGANNPTIWLGENWIDLDKPVVVAEGPMDLAKIMTVYRNVASPLFSNPNYLKINRIADAMDVITFLDKGTGGDSGRKKFKGALKHSVVTHLLPPEPYGDPGEMPVEDLANMLKDVVPLDDFMV